jgi:hypothetical protein
MPSDHPSTTVEIGLDDFGHRSVLLTTGDVNALPQGRTEKAERELEHARLVVAVIEYPAHRPRVHLQEPRSRVQPTPVPALFTACLPRPAPPPDRNAGRLPCIPPKPSRRIPQRFAASSRGHGSPSAEDGKNPHHGVGRAGSPIDHHLGRQVI